MERRFTLVGPGRAGWSMHRALEACGWTNTGVFGRGDDVSGAAQQADVCILAVPDRNISSVADQIHPGDAVVIHLSGATPVAALDPHRSAALHPLASLAEPVSGAQTLASTFYAVGGDPIAEVIADELSGKWFRIDDSDRPLYHAAAAVASNHFVALLGQVDRISREIGVPFEAFLPLVQSSLENVIDLGPTKALTGPAARGDHETIEAHLEALGERLPEEVSAYQALVEQARRLVAGDSETPE